ncbi:MAG TPA: UbiA family prenyltransferase [Nitrososphaerales archaeon]|nr:UbiA family prenyltransferase [Nitrososphaerales archaeon]
MSVGASIYKELVYGGHLLALGTASMAATVAFVIGRTPSLDLLFMAYLFSFGAYSINRAADFDEDKVSHPDRTRYLEGRRSLLVAIAGGAFLVGYAIAIFRNLVFFAGLLVPLLLALAYSVGSSRVKGSLGISRLKEGLFVKNVAISFGWSLIPILVGLYYLSLPVALLALAPFIFLRLMVNTIFFDQRDVEADRAAGVKTLPSELGISRSSRIIDTIDLLSGAYILLLVAGGVIPIFATFLAIFIPYSFAYRAYAGTGKHRDSLRDVAADGEYILWGFVTYLGHL